MFIFMVFKYINFEDRRTTIFVLHALFCYQYAFQMSLPKSLDGSVSQAANLMYIRGMAGKFVDTISIFNRKRNSVKMNISAFAKIIS